MTDDNLLYVELKTGFDNDGPAWIGRGCFSRTGGTLYFHGRALRKGQTAKGNFLDAESGEAYCVSGARRDGRDRLPGRKRLVEVDAVVVARYLHHSSRAQLPQAHYRVVEFLPCPIVRNYARENKSLEAQPALPR